MNESTDVSEIYLEVQPRDIAYIKFIIESYEVLGIIRTVDPAKAIVVLLAVPDAADLAEGVLTALGHEIPIKRVPRPEQLGDDWLLGELTSDQLRKT